MNDSTPQSLLDAPEVFKPFTEQDKKRASAYVSRGAKGNCQFCHAQLFSEQLCQCGWKGDYLEQRHCHACHLKLVKEGRIKE
jgi:hypothetical protein